MRSKWGVWLPFRVRWFHLFQSVVLLASLSVFKQREGPGSREDHLSLNMVDAIDDPIDYLGEIAFERFYVIEAVRESLCRFQFLKRIVQHDTHTSTRHGTYRKGKWGGPTWMMLRYFLSLYLSGDFSVKVLLIKLTIRFFDLRRKKIVLLYIWSDNNFCVSYPSWLCQASV